jgi:PAS domain S-box-containing protein
MPDLTPIFILIFILFVWRIMKSHKLLLSVTEYVAGDVINIMSDSLLLMDDRQRIVFVNRAACDLLRFSAAELENMQLNELLREKTDFARDLQAVRLQGNRLEYSLDFIPKNGGALKVSMIFTGIFDRFGNIDGILGIGRDITSEMELEKKENSMQEQFEAALRSLAANREKLDTINKDVVEREMMMVAIKEEINSMLKQKGLAEKYRVMEGLR